MWQKININDMVRIKRTPEVDAIVLHEYGSFWGMTNPDYLIKNPLPFALREHTEYLEFPLWDFMNKYGVYLYQGANVPVELINMELKVK